MLKAFYPDKFPLSSNISEIVLNGVKADSLPVRSGTAIRESAG